jgi:hypothetical protein
MKFYKRQSIDSHNPQDDKFAVEADGRLISDSTESFKLPGGTNAQRPLVTESGQVRHNTSIEDLETLVRTTWERIRTVRPANITVQNLGSGNYYSNIFGPLNESYSQSYDSAYSGGPANIQVYVDNVFQIPFTNYDLTVNPSPVIAQTTATSSATSTILYLNNVTNVQPGQRISGAAGISSSTVVVGTITGTSNIEISEPISTSVNVNTSLTFTFNTGTFIQFTGAVPAKPVVVLLGLDGYFPAS